MEEAREGEACRREQLQEGLRHRPPGRNCSFSCLARAYMMEQSLLQGHEVPREDDRLLQKVQWQEIGTESEKNAIEIQSCLQMNCVSNRASPTGGGDGALRGKPWLEESGRPVRSCSSSPWMVELGTVWP